MNEDRFIKILNQSMHSHIDNHINNGSYMADYVIEYPHAFTKEFCDSLIQTFESNPQAHQKHSTEGYKFTQLDLNGVDPGVAMYFAQNIEFFSQRYFAELGLTDYIPEHGYEDVRIKKYMPDTGDMFAPHVDVLDWATAKRFLIWILYLTDNPKGGTYFPTLNKTVKCEAGKLVAFPPTWQYPHAGLEPVESPKYICMTSMAYL